jgi:hypothetical protein
MKKTILAAAAAWALTAAAAQAAVVTIDFESGSAGAVIGSDYAALGATFSGAYYYGCGGGCPAPAFGHFASGLAASAPITVTFATLQSSVSFVSVSDSSLIASAYDASNTLLDSTSDLQGFPISGAPVVLSGANIAYVTFAPKDNVFFFGYGIDDLTFNSGRSGGGVPEPASWTLMILGFGGVGATLRCRRRNAAEAAA